MFNLAAIPKLPFCKIWLSWVQRKEEREASLLTGSRLPVFVVVISAGLADNNVSMIY